MRRKVAIQSPHEVLLQGIQSVQHAADVEVDLLDRQRLQPRRVCAYGSGELVRVDATCAVEIHEIDQVDQVGLCEVDQSSLEELRDQGHSVPQHIFPCGLATLVQGQLRMDVCRVRLQGLDQLLQVLPRLFDAQLVLLEHALADDAGQQSDHAEASDDHEADEEQRQERLAFEEAFLVDESREIRRRHQHEERHHGGRYVPEEKVEELMVRIAFRQSATCADHDDGAHVQHHRHKDRDPEDGVHRIDKSEGQQIQLLQEFDDAE
mmetsp:Transcript_7384/g.20945  ORF Transcript_7384/g.20945 Transcript_7384/m.20945 type:complete len:264 (+) Transcript_7384:1002-1793(+)